MIIAFGHESGTGKDTFVMFLIEHLRHKFRLLDISREGFADKLYDLCQSLYGWAGFESRQYYLLHPQHKERALSNGMTPREILIGMAEKMREFDPHAFLNPVYRNSVRHVKFITDLRTLEEAEIGKQLGVYMVRIQRANKPLINCRVSAILRGRDDLWDETLYNDGTMTEWRTQAVEFCERKVVPHIQECLREKR